MRAALKRNWWILLLTCVLGAGVQFYSSITKVHPFVSASRLLVNDQAPIDEKTGAVLKDPSWFNTVILQLESAEVKALALQRVKLSHPEWNGDVSISARNEPNSYIFEVKGSGGDPEQTRLTVGAVVESFIDRRKDEWKRWTSDATRDASDDVERQRKLEEKARDNVARFSKEKRVPFLREEYERQTKRLSALKQRLPEQQQDIETFNKLSSGNLVSLADIFGEGGPRGTGSDAFGNPGISAERFGSPAIAEWVERSIELQNKEAELREKAMIWKPRHPWFQELQKEVEDLRRSVQTREKLIREQVKSQVTRMKVEADVLSAEIRELEESGTKLKEGMVEFQALEAEVKRAEENVSRSRSRLEELQKKQRPPDFLSVMSKATPGAKQ
jgi:predicted nuclease with TOPRIM domain